MASKSPVSMSSTSLQKRPSSTPQTPRRGSISRYQPTSIDAVTTSSLSTTAPDTIAFPPPQTFDFLPPLHALLARLLSSTNASSYGGGPGIAVADETASQQQQLSSSSKQSSQTLSQLQSQSQLATQPTVATSTGNSASLPGQQQAPSGVPPFSSQKAPTMAATSTEESDIPPSASSGPPSLDAKDLLTASSGIKIRIQKSRVVVSGLPDISRSVEEQEVEIQELEEKIGRLKAVVKDFGRRAGNPNEKNLATSTAKSMNAMTDRMDVDVAS